VSLILRYTGEGVIRSVGEEVPGLLAITSVTDPDDPTRMVSFYVTPRTPPPARPAPGRTSLTSIEPNEADTHRLTPREVVAACVDFTAVRKSAQLAWQVARVGVLASVDAGQLELALAWVLFLVEVREAVWQAGADG
jgi:hypothetical protein